MSLWRIEAQKTCCDWQLVSEKRGWRLTKYSVWQQAWCSEPFAAACVRVLTQPSFLEKIEDTLYFILSKISVFTNFYPFDDSSIQPIVNGRFAYFEPFGYIANGQ